MGELAVDAVITSTEVHLLDAATVTLPPGVRVAVVDSDAGDRYSVADADLADGARKAANTFWISVTRPSGTFKPSPQAARTNALAFGPE